MHDRGWIELGHAPLLDWEPLPAEGWPYGAEAKVLSRDPSDGAFTGIVRLRAGYRRWLGHCTADIEVFVLSGALRLGDGVKGYGWFGYLPAGVTSSPWTAESDVELLVCARTGAPHFKPEPGPVTSHDGVIAIPKASSVEHVEANADALDVQFDAEDLERLDHAFPPPTHETPLDII